MQRADLMFKALGDPTRRSLFEHQCRHGEMTVRELTEWAGTSQPTVSKHLAVLKKAGLITGERRGRETYYAAVPDGLVPLVEWTDQMTRFWEAKFDRLDDVLKRMDQ